MNKSFRVRFGVALTIAILVVSALSLENGTARAAPAATSTRHSTLRTSWANRYVLPARTPAPGHVAPKGKVGTRPTPSLVSQSLFDLTNPDLDFNDSLNTSPSIAVDPITASSVTPKVINAQNVDVAVAITYTANDFASTSSDYTDLTGAIKSGANTADADVVFQPSTLWSSKATCNVGFVATTAYTTSFNTYANGIALYKVSAAGAITSTPTSIIGYYNTAGAGTNITMTIYDQPSLSYNPNGGGSNGRLFAFFVGSTWTTTVGSAPTTYTGSDVFRSYSDDCGATWTSPLALSNSTSSSCVSQYAGHGNCDDVYYPSGIVTKNGVTWFSFLCQCADSPGPSSTGRGIYAVFSNRSTALGTFTLREAFTVNNGVSDLNLGDSGTQSLPGGQFYANSQGNLAYNPNVKTANGTPDGGLLLTYSHATVPGDGNTWKVVVISIPIRPDGSRGNNIRTVTVGNLTVYPHIADRVSTSTGGNPVVGYYSWSASTHKVIYNATRFTLANNGALSNSTTLSSGLAHDPKEYIGETTGLDVNAVAADGSPDYSKAYASFTGPGPNANDNGDNWIWVLNK